jgi:glutamate dehydrogenase
LLKKYLFSYFPAAVRERFKTDLAAHPLGANIIATQVANTLIDSMGITFVHRMCVSYSVAPIHVLKCALAAEHILDSERIRHTLRKFDTHENSQNFLALNVEVSRALMDAASWLLSSHDATLTLDKLVALYEEGYRAIMRDVGEVLSGKEAEAYHARLAKYSAMGLDASTASTLAIAPRIVVVLEMLWASRQAGKDTRRVGRVFSHVMEELGVGSFLSPATTPDTTNKWESEVILNSTDEIRRSLSALTTKLLELNAQEKEDTVSRLRASTGYERLKGTLDEARTDTASAAVLSVVAKQLRSFQVT